jgi:hypothetical protein
VQEGPVEQEEMVSSPAVDLSPHKFLSHRQLGRSSSIGVGFLLGAPMVELSKVFLITRTRTFVLTIAGILQEVFQQRMKMQAVRMTLFGSC